MERQQPKEILRVTIDVSRNLYSMKIKSMMNFFVFAVFDPVAAHQENRQQILRTET